MARTATLPVTLRKGSNMAALLKSRLPIFMLVKWLEEKQLPIMDTRAAVDSYFRDIFESQRELTAIPESYRHELAVQLAAYLQFNATMEEFRKRTAREITGRVWGDKGAELLRGRAFKEAPEKVLAQFDLFSS